ncbi:MAG TPA: serine/threonine protein kinase [Oligoflexia bacterium]|nr:serine/threonine protein kinase [Oligoflexia bacterium]HMR25099.1 serine/threonine protein kinase [Oligoflexia bacterium]
MSHQEKSTTHSSLVWGKETQYFFELGPDQILNAIEQQGYICTGRCFALNSFENRVYEIEIESDDKTPLAHKKVAKFYRPGRWSKAQILEEHAFLLDLQKNEIPVVAPEIFPDATTLKTTDTGIHFCVFPKVGGRLLEEPNTDDYLQLGRLVARIHQVGQSQSFAHRYQLNEKSFALDHLQFLTQEWQEFPMHHAQKFSSLVTDIAHYAQPLFAQFTSIRLHGDCHFGNILKNQEQVFFVDFDDCIAAPEIQDLWLLAKVTEAKPFTNPDFNILIEGYEQIRPFNPAQAQLAAPLRAMRMIHFSAWIARRWQDPSFPQAFPEFNSEKYWQEQINELENIVQNFH